MKLTLIIKTRVSGESVRNMTDDILRNLAGRKKWVPFGALRRDEELKLINALEVAIQKFNSIRNSFDGGDSYRELLDIVSEAKEEIASILGVKEGEK